MQEQEQSVVHRSLWLVTIPPYSSLDPAPEFLDDGEVFAT